MRREREEGSFRSSPPNSTSCKDGIDGTDVPIDGWMDRMLKYSVNSGSTASEPGTIP
ncbi:hypothetical protein LOAG_08825 [Loa loa]|uniref:Uncharacterized protein n=1 Tax=Loa loa TaxID=7209 RepID=A0A1S0TT70_LOALO|nr:hypothetical protein LOAG_08825 [Loa loa]EFO19670.1 hypothetical protein LOAG_08825 [Loa loa]